MVLGANEQSTQRVQQALSESPFYALRRLRVKQTESGLLISGRVSTFYQKQQAQEIVRMVSGGMHVVNSVEVSS